MNMLTNESAAFATPLNEEVSQPPEVSQLTLFDSSLESLVGPIYLLPWEKQQFDWCLKGNLSQKRDAEWERFIIYSTSIQLRFLRANCVYENRIRIWGNHYNSTHPKGLVGIFPPGGTCCYIINFDQGDDGTDYFFVRAFDRDMPIPVTNGELHPLVWLYAIVNGLLDPYDTRRVIRSIAKLLETLEKCDSKEFYPAPLLDWVHKNGFNLHRHPMADHCWDHFPMFGHSEYSGSRAWISRDRDGKVDRAIRTLTRYDRFCLLDTQAVVMNGSARTHITPLPIRPGFINSYQFDVNPQSPVLWVSDFLAYQLFASSFPNHLTTYFEGSLEELKKHDLDCLEGRDLRMALVIRASFDPSAQKAEIEKSLQVFNSVQNSLQKARISFYEISPSQDESHINYKTIHCLADYAKSHNINLKGNEDPMNSAILPNLDDIVINPDLIEGLITHASVNLIAGPQKIGKTLFMMHVVRELLCGGEIFGMKASKAKVLLFDTELTPQEYKRRGLGNSENLTIVLNEILKETLNEADPDKRRERTLDHLEKYIKKHNINVFVLDCAYRFIDDTCPNQTRQLIGWAKKMAANDVTSFFVHHCNKRNLDPANPFTTISGHSNLVRGVDSTILLMPQKLKKSEEEDKEEEDIAKKVIEFHFNLRSFRGKAPIATLIQNGVHTPIVPIRAAQSASPVNKWADFIRTHVPASRDDAWPTKMIVQAMVDANLGKASYLIGLLKKLVTKDYLNVITDSPYRYYQGSKIASLSPDDADEDAFDLEDDEDTDE